MPQPTYAAVLVAAGRSRRMGADKLWIELWGRPVWRWSLDVLLAERSLAPVAVVVPADAIDRFRAHVPRTVVDRCLFTAGGAERADSVLAGLSTLTDAGCTDETVVLVHDAARPAASRELVHSVAAAGGKGRAAVPALPVPDTLLRADGSGTVERGGLVAAQTPQLGRLGDLRRALGAGGFTDEASALMAAGVEVRVVDGEPANRKLTEPRDEAVLLAVLRDRAVVGMAVPQLSAGARAGIGFDAHRFEAGRPLRLGGLEWPDAEVGLAGHSDGDAALHALIDALLGAAGAGDVGTLFPPSEDAWRDADSADLLERAVARIRAHGWRPASVDLTVVAAAPSIAARRDALTARIAAALGIPPVAVSVKGTTSDGLGFGGEEGIAAYAVAVVEYA